MQRDWVAVWILLLSIVWLCSAWCWLAPSVPGVWGQGCVSVVDGQHDEVCESVTFLSNFPRTQMLRNQQLCETDTTDDTNAVRCK